MGGARWTAPDVVQARVFAGGVPIPYAQSGEGDTVVLLHPANEEDPTKTLFFGELSRHLRVVAPVLPSGGDVHAGGEDPTRVALSHRLRDFIDGLGLARVGLVAEGPFGIPALGFALLDPERVARTALVFRDELDPALPVAAASEKLETAGSALLVLRVGSAPDLDELVRFLTGSDEHGPEDTEP